MLTYIKFDEVNPNEFMALLNNPKNRTHLIAHDIFTLDSAKAWINSKIEVNSILGCKVRAIFYKNELVGWCAIQLQEEQYEIAIIINDTSWGLGTNVFKDMMKWAKELGHHEVYIHFLHTRPNYKFLEKIAKNVYKTELLNNKFTTYELEVK